MSTIRVDKIRPFQSSSVIIEGGIIQANAATTGSNTFVGNQNIQGTITASIAEGFALVGGVGNVSTLVATSSFGGALTSGLVSGSSQLTASYDVRYALSGSIGTTITTGSFATTGSNTFKGNQIISASVDVSGSINSDGYELAASSTSTIPALNSTFNSDFSSSSSTFINKSLVLGDGKVLVAGRFTTIDGHTTNDIARFNSNGTIDTSFAAPMFSGSNFSGGDTAGWINTFVTQSDDKILVGGNFVRVGEGGDARRGIARLNANGTLDTSFVTQSFGAFSTTYGVRDIVIQNDDKIVFVGDFTSGSRRVNTDGTIDTSFNINQGNNQPTAFNNGEFHSVALLDSGSEQAILIGGEFQGWGSFASYTHIVKLHPSGALDSGFAGTNLDITTGNSLDRIKKIKVGDDGYIYVAGRFKDTLAGPNVRHAGFARLTTTDEGDGIGAFESGFRTYISGSDQNLSGVTVYVNDFDFYDGDKILLGGNFITFGIPTYSTTSANRFAIVSQTTGNLISGWAASGSASTYNLNTGSVNSVTLLPNNNVLVGGTFTSASSPQTAREGLASLKLTGFGNVTTTSDYSITADTTQLLISSSNTYFSGDITASTISGSFVGDGSGLTNLVLPSGVVSGSSQLTSSLDSRYLNVSGEGTISGSFTGSFTGSVTVAPSKAIIFSDEHIAISSYGLVPNTSGSYVIKIGQGAGNVNQVSFNTFIGHYAGYSNTTGQNNTYVGNTAAYNNVAGIENTYVGTNTGGGAVSGSQNAILGFGTGYYSNGNNNTFIGTRAVTSLGTGSENVVVGAYAATGSSNDEYLKFLSASVIVGFGASPNDDNETNQVIIGHKAIGKGSNTVTIGNDTITNTYLKGTISGSVFTGSFVGDGSGLTGIPGVTPIQTGSFATTGSNTFKAEQTISSSLIVTDIIKGTGSIFLQPDVNDSRDFRIYNTAPSDIHIKGNAAYSFFGDDTNYLKIDDNTGITSIVGVNGVVVSGSLNASGSNTFVGNQTISGSVRVSGSISQKGVGGTGNIVIGENPLTNLTSEAIYNVIIGQDAGVLNSSGSSNVYIGRNAGILNQIGNSNVMIGTYAGYNAKNSANVYIGESAGAQNISGQYNVAIGYQAGYNNKVNLNTFIGWQSGFANSSGSGNTFVGERSGESNTIGNNNSFFGGSSGRDTIVGSNNTFIGQNAGQQNTSGSFSTFVGSQAGSYTTTGNNNTFVGASAGILNTTGYSNAFFGDNSGLNNTTAYENTFVGSFSGYENRTGAQNTFVGTSAGQNTRIGNDNTYIGHRAGNSNVSGSNNTFVGLNAGFNITSGSDNTFFGKNTGYYISDGSSAVSGSNRSVFIGTNVKSNGHNQTNQIVIGYDAVGNGSNTVTIGNNDITDTYVKGVLRASTAILAQVSSSYNFADDTAAQAGGVPLGGLYHTSGTIKIRLV